jgi:hypothetical protein
MKNISAKKEQTLSKGLPQYQGIVKMQILAAIRPPSMIVKTTVLARAVFVTLFKHILNHVKRISRV